MLAVASLIVVRSPPCSSSLLTSMGRLLPSLSSRLDVCRGSIFLMIAALRSGRPMLLGIDLAVGLAHSAGAEC